MDNKVSYVLVGLFVIVLGSTFIASVIWLATSHEQKTYDTYQAYMKESVSGLNKNALVKYRGVEVGQVRDISLVPERPEEVRLLLNIEQGTPIKRDSLATLVTQGLTGLAYVEITGGSRDAPDLEREEGKIYREIKTKPSLLVRIDSAISLLLQKFQDVSGVADTLLASLNRLADTTNSVLSPENRLAVTHILDNVDTLSRVAVAHANTLDRSLTNVAITLDNTAKISGQVSTLLTQLERTLAATEQTVTHIEPVLTAVAQAANAVTQTAKNADILIHTGQQGLGKTTQLITDTAAGLQTGVKDSRQDLSRFANQTLPELAASLRELRDLLNTLRNFSQQLERKPNAVIFGKSKTPPGPGE